MQDKLLFSAVMLFALVLAHAGPVRAQTWDWSRTSVDSGMPTSASHLDGSLAYATAGAIQLVDASDGLALANPYRTGGMRGGPVLVSLYDVEAAAARAFVFAATRTGYLYKLNGAGADVGAVLQLAQTSGRLQQRDLRRGSCPGDELIAEPVVQRRADSNAAFTLDADVVVAATAYGCGDTTQNQILGFDAADITAPPLWVVNLGEYEIGVVRSCLLDLARNRVHCVADQPTGASVWSIDTMTGSLAWVTSIDAAVHARPVLGASEGPGNGHLYVGDMAGHVHAIDADTGAITANAEFISAAPGSIPYGLAVGAGIYAGLVFVTADSGRLFALYDSGSELIETWQAGYRLAVTAPVAISALGRVYAANSDGTFSQYEMRSGAEQAGGPLFFSGGPGLGASVVLDAYRAGDGIHRLVGTTYSPTLGTVTRQFRVPCATAVPGCVYEPGVTDATPPTIEPVVNGLAGNAGWYVSDVTLTWAVADAESTVTATTGCGAQILSDDTAGTAFTCAATSAGGTATQTLDLKRDATAPAANATATPIANDYGWRNRAVTVVFAGTDAMSGGVTCDAQVVLGAQGGNQSASGRCYDAAGNQSALASATGINIDLTAPGVTITSPVSRTYNRNEKIIARYNCADDLAGLAACAGDVASGQQIRPTKKTQSASFTVTATDKAGNVTRQTIVYSVK